MRGNAHSCTSILREAIVDGESTVASHCAQIVITDDMRALANEVLNNLNSKSKDLLDDEQFKSGGNVAFYEADLQSKYGPQHIEFYVNNRPDLRSLSFGDLVYDKIEGVGKIVLFVDERWLRNIKQDYNRWYYLILHELVHSIDPKFDIKTKEEMDKGEEKVWELSRKFQTTALGQDAINFMDEYLKLPYERDAWIASLTEEVVDKLKRYDNWEAVKDILGHYRPSNNMEINMIRNKNLWRDYLSYLYKRLYEHFRGEQS